MPHVATEGEQVRFMALHQLLNVSPRLGIGAFTEPFAIAVEMQIGELENLNGVGSLYHAFSDRRLVHRPWSRRRETDGLRFA